MDIVELLQREIHRESAAIAPQTMPLIEVAKLAIEEIERLRALILFAANDLSGGVKPPSRPAKQGPSRP